MNYYTTIEQSKKLIELGLDIKTADMYYPHLIRMGSDTYDVFPVVGEFDYPYELPCWSVGKLLEFFPTYIQEYGELVIKRDSTDKLILLYDDEEVKFSSAGDTFVDRLVDGIEWLLKKEIHLKNTCVKTK